MWIKCSKRRAGCIAISFRCLLHASLWGATAPDYRVGTGEAGFVKAVAMEDRQGNRAVFADAPFTITLASADWIAARLLQAYPLRRDAILLHSTRPGAPVPQAALDAIAVALSKLEAAHLFFDGSRFSATSGEGQCLAVFFPVAFEGCAGGTKVRPPIRSAFQLLDQMHGLQRRNGTQEKPPSAYPLQAIAFGKQGAILALGGDPPLSRFRFPGLIVVPHCNAETPFPEEAATAIRQVLTRVGR
jgi:hypothetical protein